MNSDQRWLPLLLTLVMTAGVGVCLWTILSRNTTATEALLLSVLLTVFSVIGSWIASAYYAEHSFDRNLRVFALKASEKVTNLSNELDRLIGFLQQELNAEDYESPSEALLARDMRMQAAIHVINTLKSVNDRSLSDWEGVIGEEIIAQREEQEQREEQLRELLERVSTLPHADLDSLMHDPDQLRRDLEAVRRDIRVLGAQIGGVPVRQARTGKETVQKPCPHCSKIITYRQKLKPTSVKAIQCGHCQTRLFSIVQNGEFVLNERLLRLPRGERRASQQHGPRRAPPAPSLLPPWDWGASSAGRQRSSNARTSRVSNGARRSERCVAMQLTQGSGALARRLNVK